MLQQIIAIFIIAIFVFRLIIQKKKQKIKNNEFFFWLGFWALGILAIIFIRQIDRLLINLGFSGSGINFLLYISVIIIFYLIFKLRLNIAKTEENITKIARQIALNNAKQDNEKN